MSKQLLRHRTASDRTWLLPTVQVMMVALLLLTGCASVRLADGSPDNAASPPAVMDARELIVLTATPVERLVAGAEARGYVVQAIHPLAELDDVLVVFRIPEGRTIPEAIEEIEAAVPGVTAGAHHLYQIQSSIPSGRDYAGGLIQWPENGCVASQPVGLIDAGVSPEHPGLIDGRIAQRRFISGNAPPATDHGTVMADLLIGPGRLRGGRLYSANVVDPAQGRGDMAGVVSILRAVDWMRSNGVSIINISLAGPRNRLMNRALGRAAEAKMVFVAAAGNLGPDAPPQYPAAFPFVLAVTAVDRDRNVYRDAIRGGHIDLAAPGVDILIESEGRLRVKSGTSVAAPFVTAVLAAKPSASIPDINTAREKLQSRAIDLGEPGPDPVYGAGLVMAPPTCFG
ncbi:MAG: S8 family serine peptidase [Pseudomonadota bacterium]